LPRFLGGFDGGQIEHRFVLGMFASKSMEYDVWPEVKAALREKGVAVNNDRTVLDQGVLWDVIDDKLLLVYHVTWKMKKESIINLWTCVCIVLYCLFVYLFVCLAFARTT
jgi:hypothetical protein